MLIEKTDGALRALLVGHAVVQLGSELVDADAVTFKHDEKMIHHVSGLIAQMVAGRIGLGGERIGHARVRALVTGKARQHHLRRFHVLGGQSHLVGLLDHLLQRRVGIAREQAERVATLPRIAASVDGPRKRLERGADLRRRSLLPLGNVSFFAHEKPFKR